MEAFYAELHDEEFNQEVKDMITLGTLDPNWDRGLSKKEARKKFNKIRGHQGTDTSEKILENEDFNQEDFNQEVKDMITLGTLDPNWDRGLSKKEARKKFNRIHGYQNVEKSGRVLQNEDFNQEDFNQEVKDMIALGTLDPNWDRGLTKTEARKKFNQIHGYQNVEKSGRVLENEDFNQDDFNQEVKDMITLGTLDPNWDRGLSKKEARKKFNKIRGYQGTDTSEKILENEDFNQEDFNQEVKDMITLGTLDPNWDRGLSKKEARKKFNKIRGYQGTDTSEKILENEDFNQEDFNQEVKDMITLGTLDPNWDRGLTKKEARKKFNKIRGHQGTDTSEKILENEDFNQEDFNQEVKDMITLGTLDPNWDRGLTKKEARKKFNKIRGHQGTDTSEKILENEDFNQEDFNQEVKDMITLGTLDPNWDRGLSKKEARKKFNKIRGYQGTDTSEKILENEDFNQEDFNQEVKDMITLGTLDPNWDRGLSKKEARKKFNKIRGHQGTDTSEKILENEDFNQEDFNQEVKDMITLGTLDPNWDRGLTKKEAKIKFNRIHGYQNVEKSGRVLQNEDFNQEDFNQEVKDMITLGTLDPNWDRGLSKKEARKKFNKIRGYQGTDTSEKILENEDFNQEEFNQEVKDMIAVGTLDPNWDKGLTKKEARIKFNKIRGYQSPMKVLENEEFNQEVEQFGSRFGSAFSTPKYSDVIFEDERMNTEIADMIQLGIMDKDWAKGLNKNQAKIEFNKIINGPLKCTLFNQVQTAMKNPTASKPKSSSSTKRYSLVTVNRDDPIFKEILYDFKSGGVEKKIKSIQIVRNEKREKLFEEESNQLERLRGNDFHLNIRSLYHGSNAPTNLLCTRGLDQRLSRVGLFGRGIYFSDNVKKSVSYLDNKRGALYKCSVILGDTKVYPDGESHPELKQEPEKDNGDYYDSIKGNVKGHNEYVLYDNRRCLIKYRIVLEGTEDESDIEDLEEDDTIDKLMAAWKRHMNYLVDTCKHDNDDAEDAGEEVRNIEKIRLEIRRRRALDSEQPFTDVNYELLRNERKQWHKHISKAGVSNDKAKPEPVEEDENVDCLEKEYQDTDFPTVGEASTEMVLDNLVSEFMQITNCEDIELATNLIMSQNWDLHRSLDEYFKLF